MEYLRVECHICGMVWNFFEEIPESEPPRATTAVKTRGGLCPRCGAIGYISQMADGANIPAGR